MYAKGSSHGWRLWNSLFQSSASYCHTGVGTRLLSGLGSQPQSSPTALTLAAATSCLPTCWSPPWSLEPVLTPDRRASGLGIPSLSLYNIFDLGPHLVPITGFLFVPGTPYGFGCCPLPWTESLWPLRLVGQCSGSMKIA